MCVSDFSSLSLSPSLKVSDSSARRSDGTAGRMAATENLKELRSLISLLSELGVAAAERPEEVTERSRGCLTENTV